MRRRGKIIRKQAMTEKLPKMQKGFSKPNLWINDHNNPNNITKNPECTNSITKDHWGTVWSETYIPKEKMDYFLKSYKKQIPNNSQLSVSDVEIASVLANSGSPSPGINWIPFSAYKYGGPDMNSVFQGIVQHRMHGDLKEFPAPSNFNECILYLPPKKPCATDENEPVYTTDRLRPITVSNTENRILSSIFKIPLS